LGLTLSEGRFCSKTLWWGESGRFFSAVAANTGDLSAQIRGKVLFEKFSFCLFLFYSNEVYYKRGY